MPKVRKPKTETKKLAEVVVMKSNNKLDKYYLKYAHIVPGSIKEVDKDKVVNGVMSKGVICQIKCTSCGGTRTINIQDAFQVHLCLDCKKNRKKANKKVTKVA